MEVPEGSLMDSIELFDDQRKKVVINEAYF